MFFFSLIHGNLLVSIIYFYIFVFEDMIHHTAHTQTKKEDYFSLENAIKFMNCSPHWHNAWAWTIVANIDNNIFFQISKEVMCILLRTVFIYTVGIRPYIVHITRVYHTWLFN